MLLARTKLNSKNVVLSKSLIDSYISYEEFVSGNNELIENDGRKKEINNLETS